MLSYYLINSENLIARPTTLHIVSPLHNLNKLFKIYLNFGTSLIILLVYSILCFLKCFITHTNTYANTYTLTCTYTLACLLIHKHTQKCSHDTFWLIHKLYMHAHTHIHICSHRLIHASSYAHTIVYTPSHTYMHELTYKCIHLYTHA